MAFNSRTDEFRDELQALIDRYWEDLQPAEVDAEYPEEVDMIRGGGMTHAASWVFFYAADSIEGNRFEFECWIPQKGQSLRETNGLLRRVLRQIER